MGFPLRKRKKEMSWPRQVGTWYTISTCKQNNRSRDQIVPFFFFFFFKSELNWNFFIFN